MTMQQQATQGLFLSPGEREIKNQVQYYTIKLLWFIPIMQEKKLQLALPILAHFQKIPKSLQDKS